MPKSLKIFVVVTGILAAVLVTFPHALFAGLILFILPGLILAASPMAFLISLTFLIGGNLLIAFGRKAAFWGPACFLAVVCIGSPIVLNQPTRAEIKRLSDSNLNPGTIQFAGHELALLVPESSSLPKIKATDCNDICLRLLFNNSVQAVVMGLSPNWPNPDYLRYLDEDYRLMRYRIERRESCPTVIIPNAGEWADESIGQFPHKTIISDRVYARIRAGECLISEPANMAAANIVIVDQTLMTENNNSSLNAYALRRLSIHERDKDRVLREIFRQTEIEAEPVFTPLIVVPNGRCGDGICRTEGLVFHRTKTSSGRYELRSFLKKSTNLNVGIVEGVKAQ